MKFLKILMPLAAAMILSAGCDSVDDSRIPYSEVRLTFPTVGDWHIYGVQGDAAAARSYILTDRERVPAGFPFTALSRTGYGGILLAADVMGDLHAFDLACPVEIRPTVRISIDTDHLCGRCAVCGSTYDIFSNAGMPLSGPAQELGYALQRYSVTYGGAGEYLTVTR